MFELVVVEPLQAGVVAVVLNEPQRRNPLSIALLEQLCDAVDHLERDPAQRVVILRGAGEVFSAGLDLKEAADDTLAERSAECVERALRKLRETPLVTVAAVHGGAFAGGAGLLAACDIVIAATDARIGFPEARRGLLPALICGVLKAKVREGDLRELFLAGEPIGAARARELGLVQRVVTAEHLLDEAVALARAILAGGPETIRLTKRLLNEMYRLEGAAWADRLAEMHLDARRSAEAREGLAAFFERREPNWT